MPNPFKINFPFFNNRTIITLTEFLQNPTGKRSSYMGKRENIIKDLNNRYYKLLAQEKGKFKFKIYKDGEVYLFHFLIPTETVGDLYYDVVLEFIPHVKEVKSDMHLLDYSLNFFSNSPHMMFTYTYVLSENQILVDFLKRTKCSKRALNERPRVTNPVEQFGFEKTCYFAASYIKDNKLYLKSVIEPHAINVTRQIKISLLNQIKSQEMTLAMYNKRKEMLSNEKKKKKKKTTTQLPKPKSRKK